MWLGVATMVVFTGVAVAAGLAELGAPEADAGGQATDAQVVGPGAEPIGSLPEMIVESSGVAMSRADTTRLWTHNDGEDGRVFLLRRNGELVAVVQVQGEEVVDLEDIAVGDCPQDIDAPSCLYLADTGDNARSRESYAILVAAEPSVEANGPAPGSGQILDVPFTAFRFRYPGGSRDTESLTLTPEGDLIVVTKGQEGSADAFRIQLAPGIIEAVPLGSLPIDVSRDATRPTGAALSPSGELIAVRSDSMLFLFASDDLTRALHRCELSDAQQGEGVDFLTEDLLVLTREGSGSPIEVLRCP